MIKEVLFSILLYTFEAFVFVYFANGFFEKKYNGRITLIITFFAHLVLLVVYELGLSYLNAIAIFIVNVILFVLLYNTTPRASFFYSALLVAIMSTSEWILIAMSAIVFDQGFSAPNANFNVFVIHNVLNKSVYLLLCFVIVKFFSKKTENLTVNSSFWGLMVMPISSMLVLLVFNEIMLTLDLSETLIFFCTIAALFLLFANFVVFLLHEHFISKMQEIYELRAIKQQEEIDETYLKILEKSNDDLHVFSHNIKHHFELITNLNSKEEVSEYIFSIYPDLDEISQTGISKNKCFDILINKYRTLCMSKNIEIHFDVKTCNLSFIDSADLSIILNNLLYNSVVAAESSSARFIKLNCFSRNKNFAVLKIINSCDSEPIVRGGRLLTSKKEKFLHGFGMKSVERTIKKYNGEMEWKYDADTKIFEVLIVFFVKF